MDGLKAIGIGLGLLLAAAPAAIGEAPEGDIENIERLAGCFAVTYRFVEDGVHDALSPDYQLDAPIIEWIGLSRPQDGEILLLHVSIVGDGRTVPHFHEIWRVDTEPGQWRHEVWSSTPEDDRSELRYDCAGGWDGNLWQCRAGEAEKPFRDDGAPFGFDRDDYDWLDRTNLVLATPRGWVHNQLNRKMTEDGDLVAHELGWITYERINGDHCRAAAEAFPHLSG